jgi:hypothetical protein
MSCNDIIDVVSNEVPGSQFDLARLISLVKQDKCRRMQMFTREHDHDVCVEEISHIRACSGHDPMLGIDESVLFKSSQKIRFNKHNQYRPDEHSGPRYAFYYTDIAGLIEVWHQNGIKPDTVRLGMSKTMIYLAPAVLDDPHYPEACRAHKDEHSVQITIDLGLIVYDGLTCYYTDDGFVAVKTDIIPMAYCCQIISRETGLYYFVRPFDVDLKHWACATLTSNETDKIRSTRSLKSEPCYICGTLMWFGTVTCIQCDSPIICEFALTDVIPNITGFPASGIVSLDDDRIFRFKERMSEGWKARAYQYNMASGIRLPPVGHTADIWKTAKRSYQQQALRWDNNIRKLHHRRYEAGDCSEATVEEKIREDTAYRMQLAKMVINCKQNVAPAQVLKSNYCRMAFDLALEKGEILRENLRTRVQTANESE